MVRVVLCSIIIMCMVYFVNGNKIVKQNPSGKHVLKQLALGENSLLGQSKMIRKIIPTRFRRNEALACDSQKDDVFQALLCPSDLEHNFALQIINTNVPNNDEDGRYIFAEVANSLHFTNETTVWYANYDDNGKGRDTWTNITFKLDSKVFPQVYYKGNYVVEVWVRAWNGGGASDTYTLDLSRTSTVTNRKTKTHWHGFPYFHQPEEDLLPYVSTADSPDSIMYKEIVQYTVGFCGKKDDNMFTITAMSIGAYLGDVKISHNAYRLAICKAELPENEVCTIQNGDYTIAKDPHDSPIVQARITTSTTGFDQQKFYVSVQSFGGTCIYPGNELYRDCTGKTEKPYYPAQCPHTGEGGCNIGEFVLSTHSSKITVGKKITGN